MKWQSLLTTTLLIATTSLSASGQNFAEASLHAVNPVVKGKRPDRTDKMTKSVIVSGEKAAQLSYGENIEKANLIVSADYSNGTFTVKQVWKGDKTLVGKTIKLASPLTMGCRQQAVPAIKNAAILLQGNKGEYTAIEIYDTPEQISYLRCFIPIYAKYTAQTAQAEHGKIVALSKLFVDGKGSRQIFEGDPSETFKKEFLFVLNTMRHAENFDIVKDLYLHQSLPAKDKLQLQEWMANTGDSRAKSVLYQALKSNDKFINSDAVSRLTYNYQNSETDKAIADAYNALPKESKPTAAKYLFKRGANKLVTAPALTSSTAEQSTPFQKAIELEQQGRQKEAQAVYMAIVQSKDDNSYAIPFAINKVLTEDSARSKVLQSRLPWLSKLATSGNYLEADDAAQILRKLKNASCLESLLAILRKRQSIYLKADQKATFAIVDLGVAARKLATAALLKDIETDTALAQKSDEQVVLLLQLAFIQENDDKAKSSKLLAENQAWANSYRQLQPLLANLPNQDEGLFLLEKLKEQKLPTQAHEWIIFRLGDLQEMRAIDALMGEFKKPYSQSATSAKDALEKIAKKPAAAKQILSHLKSIAEDSHSLSQANAIELLAAIDGAKSLPVVRQALKSGQLDAKVRALNVLSRIGNKEDVAILLPLSNYWTADRRLHYWVMQALGEIQNR